jgi:flagellar basal body-associated protein FliL
MSNSKKTTYQKRGPKRKKSLLSNPVFWVVAGVIVLAGAFFAYRKASQPGAAQASPVDVEVSGAPSLKVDQETIDFGDVPVTQMVTATFQLANAGDQPLRFTQEPYIEVKQGC